MMIPKRKKNLKIDTSEHIEVIDETEINYNYVEDFTLPPIDTGMEAEEEKEVHLKQIIEQKSGVIPVPEIVEIENFRSKYKINDKFYKYTKDIKNEYYFTDIDNNLMKDLNITKNEYKTIISNIQQDNDNVHRTVNVHNDLFEKINHKFLIRDDKFLNKSYVCFRRRIIKPNRKNRRNEIQTKEKIGKLICELKIVEQMNNYSKIINNLDMEIVDLNIKISILINKLLKSGYDKKKIKNVVNNKNVILQSDILNNILYNREGIRILKKKLKNKKDVDEEEIEREWSAYLNKGI